jgi:hypothetical protein
MIEVSGSGSGRPKNIQTLWTVKKVIIFSGFFGKFDAFFLIIQDINIASNVSRVLAARDVNAKGRSIFVTALAAAKERLPRYNKFKFSIKSVFLAKEYTCLCHGSSCHQGTLAALQQIQAFPQILFLAK